MESTVLIENLPVEIEGILLTDTVDVKLVFVIEYDADEREEYALLDDVFVSDLGDSGMPFKRVQGILKEIILNNINVYEMEDRAFENLQRQ